MDERLLKRALTKYNENKKIKKDLEDRLEVAEHKLYKGSGGWVAKMPEGAPPDAGLVFTVKLECVDKIRADLKRVNDEIAEVDKFIHVMTDCGELIRDKYINQLSVEELVIKYNYSRPQIYRMIDHLIIRWALFDLVDN